MIFVHAHNALEAVVEAFKALQKLSCCEDPEMLRESAATLVLDEGYSSNNEVIFTETEIVSNFHYGNIIHDGDDQIESEKAYYSHELIRSGKVSALLDLLRTHPSSRCGVICLWRKEHDCMVQSCPCLVYLFFRIRNKKIHMHSHMCANGVHRVLLIDLHVLTALHRYVAARLAVGKGSYVHYIDSFHTYRADTALFEDFEAKLYKPLHRLVDDNVIPDVQHIDRETVDWIRRTGNPQSRNIREILPDYKPFPVSELNKYTPHAAYYVDPRMTDSIHGQRHALRVVLISWMLANMTHNDLVDDVLPSILMAATVHDTQRLHDRGDALHGERASRWFTSNIGLFQTLTSQRLDADAIVYAVGNHDVEWSRICRPARAQYSQVLNLLKCADALDRYRLPKVAWWPDPGKIRLEEAVQLMPFCLAFTYFSEKNYVEGRGSCVESVMNTAKKLGIMA